MATGRTITKLSVSGSDEVYDFVCSLCSNEGKDVKAIELCMDCEQYMCRPCSTQHGRFKAMRAHNVVKKDQAQNLSLSILAGSEAVDFECTVCKINEMYTAASVYCSSCCKYLCTSCLRDHNRFGLIKEHDMKTVEKIRKEVKSSPEKSIPHESVAEKPKCPAAFSCKTCSQVIKVVGQLWVCINCGCSKMCRKCCEQHQLSNSGHRTVPFKEFQAMHEQYGRSFMSYSGEYMGPICSECLVRTVEKPHTFCCDCNKLLCGDCCINHVLNHTCSQPKSLQLCADAIKQMENFEMICILCYNMDRESVAAGYCLQCGVFVCTWCVKLHAIYFAQEEHRILGFKEVRARKESFFERTFRGTKDNYSNICDFCEQKGLQNGAMYRCLDCKKDLCMLCLDFHETFANEHSLKNQFTKERKEENLGEHAEREMQSAIPTTVTFFPKIIPRDKSKWKIVAIDLGSSNSGYTSVAFGNINEMADGSLTKIYSTSGWGTETLHTTKAKSCLLFDADQELRHFGEDAIVKYKELEMKGEADSWYFFNKYDKYLRDKDFAYNTKICSATEKEMAADDVFEGLISYLINHFCSMNSDLMLRSDIKLVLLVAEEPSATVLCMLKNAATKTGICDVSAVSKHTCMIKYIQMYDLPTEEFDGQLPDDIREPGKQFLVVDLGDDQIEASVYECLVDGSFKDINTHYFGEWGMKKCVTECLEIFPQIVRHDIFQEFCENHPDWRSNEISNFSFKILQENYSEGKVRVRFPLYLSDLYTERTKETVAEAVRKLPKHLNVRLSGDKLSCDKSLFETIVASCITNNIALIKTILTKHRFAKINSIIFFGILLENQQIKNAMLENFENAILVSSNDGRNTSIKAAVLSEFLKLERTTSRYTYGINICQDFTEMEISGHRVRTTSDRDVCHNIFKRYFMKGEKIFIGEPRCGRHKTVFPYQGKMVMHILQPERREPKYADENRIKELGKIEVDLSQDAEEGEAEVRMMFTETKLLVEAFVVQKDSDGKEKTTRVFSKRFDTVF